MASAQKELNKDLATIPKELDDVCDKIISRARGDLGESKKEERKEDNTHIPTTTHTDTQQDALPTPHHATHNAAPPSPARPL